MGRTRYNADVRAGMGLLLTATLVLGAGCSRKAPPATATDSPFVDEVELAGCAAILAGPVCEIEDDQALDLWLPSALGAATFAADGAPIATNTVNVREGVRHHVVLPRAARVLTMRVRDGEGMRAWSLRLAPVVAAPEVVTRGRAMRQRGELAEAATLLRDAEGSLAGVDHARAAGLRARVELSRGNSTEALRALDSSMRELAAAGRHSDAADDASVAVFVMLEQRRFGEAREMIARAVPWNEHYAEGRVISLYDEGLVSRDAGDARTALGKLAAAEQQAERLALGRLRSAAMQAEAILLEHLGRLDDALARLREVERSGLASTSPCERGILLENIGWIALVAADRDPDVLSTEARSIDPRVPLEAALTLERECKDRRQEVNVLTNLTWAALLRGDTRDARARLEEAQALLPDADAVVAFHWQRLDGEIAMQAGDPHAALVSFQRLEKSATRAGALGDAWFAADGRASALARLGKPLRALEASDEAERLLDEASKQVPLGEGRGSFLGDRERSARRRIDLLLDLGRDADALAAARRASARLVTDLQRTDRIAELDPSSRARWEDALGKYRRARDELSEEAKLDWGRSTQDLESAIARRKKRELALRVALEEGYASLALSAAPSLDPPASGTLLLAYRARTRGWVAFAATNKHVRAVRVEALDASASPSTLAQTLLAPFAADISRAARIDVHAHGALAAIDFHALPWEGRALIDRAPVTYPLDIGGAGVDGEAATKQETRALVVGDPRGDLPSARAEAAATAATLARIPRSEVRVLIGRDATRAAVLAALRDARLLHWAGHGVFSGRDGWSSALPLAGDDRLTLGDVLTLPKTPPLVVLSGCETARSGDAAHPGAALGLAHAFLLSGAHEVIAATRVVDDAVTARLMKELYGAMPRSTRDLAAALREAQRAMAQSDPSSDWAGFRALGR